MRFFSIKGSRKQVVYSVHLNTPPGEIDEEDRATGAHDGRKLCAGLQIFKHLLLSPIYHFPGEGQVYQGI